VTSASISLAAGVLVRLQHPAALFITMPAKKKTKKPAANPARGFATTSIASKPRADPTEAADAAPVPKVGDAPPSKDAPPSSTETPVNAEAPAPPAPKLTPEEFERHLEESELQSWVEKYAQKVRRDAQRQKTRLQTDRRVLRSQAETINAKRWLPQELMDHLLDLIHAEGRFAASSVSSEGAPSRLLPEEDLTIKLWTLQETLVGAGFTEEKTRAAIQFVLDIAPQVSLGNKAETIWGLEEALDWFARECAKEDLPDYDGRGRGGLKLQGGT
jgi:ATP-dependent RNA helicase DHX29